MTKIKKKNENTPWGLEAMEIADKEHQDKITKINNELNRHYLNCFKTPCGKKVLEHLTKSTIDQPTWIPELGTNQAFIREGQNSVVRDIINRINNARETTNDRRK